MDEHVSPNVAKLRANLLKLARKEEFNHASYLGIDALAAFVPTEGEIPAAVRKKLHQDGPASWEKVEGGHIVRWPFYGRRANRKLFRVEPRGWECIRCYICLDEICRGHRRILLINPTLSPW